MSAEAAAEPTTTDAVDGAPAGDANVVMSDEGQAPDAVETGSEATTAPSVEDLLEQNRKKNSENKSLRATNKELASQLEEFNAWKESQKSDEQRAKEAQDNLVAENAALKATLLRTTIKADLGLPDEIVELLQGDTEEELRAHAEKLKPLFAAKAEAPKIPAVNPGQKVLGGTQDPRARAAQALFGHIL